MNTLCNQLIFVTQFYSNKYCFLTSMCKTASFYVSRVVSIKIPQARVALTKNVGKTRTKLPNFFNIHAMSDDYYGNVKEIRKHLLNQLMTRGMKKISRFLQKLKFRLLLHYTEYTGCFINFYTNFIHVLR